MEPKSTALIAINLIDRHKENEQAEASGNILAVSLYEKRVSSQAA